MVARLSGRRSVRPWPSCIAAVSLPGAFVAYGVLALAAAALLAYGTRGLR
jgi:hypothetical protein